MAVPNASADLFSTSSSEGFTTIFLVDTSGSVRSPYQSSDKNVFDVIYDKIQDILNRDQIKEFRLLFWNSSGDSTRTDFKNGVMKLPFVVKPENLHSAFDLIKPKITQYCLTHTWLAFDSIPDDWISKSNFTNIYLFTDGEIGWGNILPHEKANCKKKLSTSIKNTVEKNKNIRIHIATVENVQRDFSRIETLTSAAGCDVYDAIKTGQLTKVVSSFVSYGPGNENGFVHYNNMICPPGYYPFKDKVFHYTKVEAFMKYVSELVPTLGYDDLCTLVNDLSKTLYAITYDKPQGVKTQIVRMFGNFFNGSQLDKVMVDFILQDCMDKIDSGRADVVTSFRHNVKELFKQADAFLKKDVCKAINVVGDTVITLPLQFVSNDEANCETTEKIIKTSRKLIGEKNLIIQKNLYPNSALLIDDRQIPILPLSTERSQIGDQCTRQWVRELVGDMYKQPKFSDYMIYLVMGKNLQVQLSDVDQDIKQAYTNLSRIMLGKKRLNTDITELESLEKGYPPIPNSGVITEFIKDMQLLNTTLGLNLRPYTLWYALCLATGNVKLSHEQLSHCISDITADFPEVKPEDLLTQLSPNIRKISQITIGQEHTLEYRCLITLEDTNETGGYIIVPHVSHQGTNCSPNQVLSKDGYQNYMESDNRYCPICYKVLDPHTGFKEVGPKPAGIDVIIPPTATVHGTYSPNQSYQKPATLAHNAPMIATVNKSTGQKRYIIILKGTVGVGKTTICTEIKRQIEEKGGECIAVGTDKYCKTGASGQVAVGMVQKDIMTFMASTNKLLVLIIDSCGERPVNLKNVFNVDLTGWKKSELFVNMHKRASQMLSDEMRQYLSWSLMNVLKRTACDANSQYWLNPDGAGYQVCIDVHTKKAKALFGKFSIPLFGTAPKSKAEAMEKIKNDAEIYANYLKTFDTSKYIEEFVNKYIE